MIALAWVPDLNKTLSALWPYGPFGREMLIHHAWTVYFTLGEAMKGLTAFYLIPWSWIRLAFLLWFATQTYDEATLRNTWLHDSPWETIILLTFACVGWTMHKRSSHERSHQGSDRGHPG